MRVKFKIKGDNLPVDYSFLTLSMIKESLKTSNQEYYESLFYFDGKKSNKKPKPFCTAVLLKYRNFDGEHFILEVPFELLVSTPDYYFFVYLYNGMVSVKEFEYKGYKYVLESVKMLKEKEIKSNTVVFKTISPICVKNKQGRYLDIDDNNFQRELKYYADGILESYRGFGLKEDLVFKPIQMRKVVRKLSKELIDGRTYYVNSWHGIFILKAHPDDLNMLYKLGLSCRRSEAFGLLDIVTEVM
ncbi:CRISPR-associated endoribonuclease Cas6 [Fervidobacterium sp.]